MCSLEFVGLQFSLLDPSLSNNVPSAVLTHEHDGQFPGGPTSIGVQC
jgi:hypothetical protein